ncbi:heterogeneous nuclear ribonucleoprotein A1-like isoform X2 [Hyposmocoma kahamanoa]|uniref:heterogeneous nuclear ribonucleoprotein A1-like isoform X2 n=1 Tax=Hyposmocoma kahamanoa TaxID=1477025 RepID=UPI000E6D6894|nr:heterogeneous nuclear ribonucleoprotein A1-like isoform X2 [Hyposmocoma kahamanoa]
MVAQKRGRGAKAQAAKAKAVTPAAEEQVPDSEVVESIEENNGQTEQNEHAEEGAGDGAGVGGEGQEGEQAENADGDAKADDKKEDKVESGKLLVENLPSSYLFDYQEKLKELFSKHGEVTSVKRGPIIVTELTTTPTLSAIVEFKNKDDLEKALTEEGTVLDNCAISVAVESRAETAVLVGVPYEAGTEYVRLLFTQCGEVAHIHEFSKTKYKILRVTFHEKEAVEKALKLDRELRINGFLVTVSKYRDEEEQKAHSANVNKNKRQHPGNQNRSGGGGGGGGGGAPNNANNARNNNYRPRGGAANFNARGNFRGARGRGGFGGRGGAFPRGGFAPVNAYMPPQGFMGRPNFY